MRQLSKTVKQFFIFFYPHLALYGFIWLMTSDHDYGPAYKTLLTTGRHSDDKSLALPAASWLRSWSHLHVEVEWIFALFPFAVKLFPFSECVLIRTMHLLIRRWILWRIWHVCKVLILNFNFQVKLHQQLLQLHILYMYCTCTVQ